MLYELLYSSGIIVGVFSFSTFLASFLCRMRNKPLFNYDNKLEKKFLIKINYNLYIGEEEFCKKYYEIFSD